MKKGKNNIFWIFSEKYGKMLKKVKNDENRSDIDEKVENHIFQICLRKICKNVKKVKNDENG